MTFEQYKAVGTAAATFDAPPSGGNLVIALYTWQNQSPYSRVIDTVTDTAGNTWSALTMQSTTAGEWRSQIWYAYNITSANPFTVTASFSGSSGLFQSATLVEVSGVIGTGDPLDDECGGSAESLSGPNYDFDAGTITPTATGGFLIYVNKYSTGSSIDAYPESGGTEIVGSSYIAHRYATLADADPLPMVFSFLGSSAPVCSVALFKSDTTEWVDIAEFVEQEISSSTYPGGTARVLGYLWSEDTGDSPLPTVQSRLYNVTDGLSVGTSPTVQAATPTEADFAVTLTPGTKRYRQQVTSDLPEIDIFWSGRGVGP